MIIWTFLVLKTWNRTESIRQGYVTIRLDSRGVEPHSVVCKFWRFETIRANCVESSFVKSNRLTGSRIVLRIVSSMRVVCKCWRFNTIRANRHLRSRIASPEVESCYALCQAWGSCANVDDSTRFARIVTCEVESPHRKSNRVTHCVKHEGRVQMLTIRHDSRESSRIVTCEVESSHRKSNRVTHCVKHEGRVQMLTIRHDSRESCRIVTPEVESSHRKSNRVRQDISHLEITIPIHVRGCHIAKDNCPRRVLAQRPKPEEASL